MDRLKLALLSLCFAMSGTASVAEQVAYDFVDAATDAVLATLELGQLPADHTDVLGLTFSQHGQSIFGFGPTYLGNFDCVSFCSPPFEAAEFFDDLNGGLGGRDAQPSEHATMIDLDPPSTSLAHVHEVEFFNLEATNFDEGFIDSMYLTYRDDTGRRQHIYRDGFWVDASVPEPGTFGLTAVALILLSVCRQYKSYCNH